MGQLTACSNASVAALNYFEGRNKKKKKNYIRIQD